MSDPIFGLTLGASGQSMVDRIEGTLSDAIRNGDLPGGHRLREIPIAQQFDCSTTPVREAIRRLASAGLVTLAPRRGAIVSAISMDEIEDLYELRMLVEPAMARRAAAAAAERPEALERLGELVRRQTEQLESGEVGDGLLDASVHAAIAELAGNVVIAGHVSNATQQVEAVQARARKWAPRGLESALHFHTRLLAAIDAGDADRAESVMREHLVEAQEGVVAGLQRQADDAVQRPEGTL
ncbi:GntR family transcriptional regulator [Ruania zhangjianzhongii]|uniref:GntR family transcriptional regulator n=1 Tax=Ruania zhangjianzhongii TaxID=2603206 RepID=UPI0011C71AD0|nr:GntR family transcriptional regulator [Ruania zhangjianzhongii]